MMGHVSLVGAGPGDPALLTRKAVMRLRAADLVLYDALVDERVLRLARRAQRFFVGKRAGTACVVSDRDSRGDDSGREAWTPRRAAERRRSLRVRPRRRRGDRARRGGRAVRHRARHQQCRGGAGSRRYSGDASRPRVGLSGRQRPRRGRLRRVDRPARAERPHAGRAHGRRTPRLAGRAPDRSRLGARDAGGDRGRRVAAATAGLARHAGRSGVGSRATRGRRPRDDRDRRRGCAGR